MIAVGSGGHKAFLRGLGVDEFIDYTKTPAEDVVHDVDLVIDAVGGPTKGRFLRTLKRGGALLPIFPSGFSGAEDGRTRPAVPTDIDERLLSAQCAPEMCSTRKCTRFGTFARDTGSPENLLSHANEPSWSLGSANCEY